MWEIVLNSIVPALVLGVFATIISVVMTNKFSTNKDKKEKQYLLLKEIYTMLYEEYNKIEKTDVEDLENFDDAIEKYLNARMIAYKNSESRLEIIKESLRKIRFVFSEDELKEIEGELKGVGELCNKLNISRLYFTLKESGTLEEICFNYSIDELYTVEEFDKIMIAITEQTNYLCDHYSTFIENKLRSLVH